VVDGDGGAGSTLNSNSSCTSPVCDVECGPTIPFSSSDCDANAATADTVRWSSTFDVGFYSKIPLHELDKSSLQRLLENPWVPPPQYKFPYSTHVKQGKEERRFVGHQHLDKTKYEWLTFSDMDKGLYCKYCVFFGHSEGGKSRVKLGNLVKTPLTKFSKLFGTRGELQQHASHQYHHASVDAGKEFLRSQYNPNRNIHSQLDSHHSREVTRNRERLMCSLENILFLGRQGLAIRGHRENMNESGGNKGNFLELMLFRKEIGDKKVEKHLSSYSKKRDRYQSNTVQNDLIQACGEEITETVVQRVKKCEFYSILFDETTDISHTSQLSLSVRYPHYDEKNKLTVREDFLSFVDPRDVLEEMQNDKECSDESDEEGVDNPDSGTGSATEEVHAGDIEQALTGTVLGQITVKILIGIGLDPDKCVGIGADGCSVNTSETVGAMQEIQKTAKNAVRAPCFNHALNLSISKSSAVPSVKKAIYVMKEIGSFFRASSKRHRRLLKVFQRTLPALCETRWVQRHEAVQVFLSGISEIHEALSTISKWQDTDTAAKASTHLASICQPEFLLTLIALQDVLASTISLSRFLQKETIDMKQASDAVRDTISVLEEKRRQCEENFEVLYNQFLELASKFEIEVPSAPPRSGSRGRHPTQNVESYFRQTVYNTMLDNIIGDLKQRLKTEVLECYDLNKFLPSLLEESDVDGSQTICKLAAKYSNLLGIPEQILVQTLKVIKN